MKIRLKIKRNTIARLLLRRQDCFCELWVDDDDEVKGSENVDIIVRERGERNDLGEASDFGEVNVGDFRDVGDFNDLGDLNELNVTF